MNVVITGATKGMGRAMAELFAAKGANLAICARTQEDINNLRLELSKINSEVEILGQAADMSKKAS